MPDSRGKDRQDEARAMRDITAELQRQAQIQESIDRRRLEVLNVEKEIARLHRDASSQLRTQQNIQQSTSATLRDWLINYRLLGEEWKGIRGKSSEVYETLSKLRRKAVDYTFDLNRQSDLMEEIHKRMESAKSIKVQEELKNLLEEERKKYDKISELQEKASNEAFKQKEIFETHIKKIAILRSLWDDILKKGLIFYSAEILSLFKRIENSAAAFRISMGLTREFSGNIESTARDIQEQFGRIGISTSDVYATARGLVNVLGSTSAFSKDIATNVSDMAVRFGVAHETSVDVLRILGNISKTTMASQKDMLYFAAALSEASGTSLSDVMGDIASASKDSYQFLNRTPKSLIQAAVLARQMGTSLSQAADSAKTLVSFTSSVASEMEASVLLGESINLQRARELAYRKDLVGLNQEILRIAQQTHFEDLDPFQQEAVAKALGKSADELARMLQADRERIAAGKSLADVQKEQERLMRRIQGNTAAWQSLMNSLSQLFNSLIPVINVISQGIQIVANTISFVFDKTGKWVNRLLAAGIAIFALIKGFSLLKGVFGIGGAVGAAAEKTLGGIAGGISKFGTTSILKGALGIAAVGAALIPFIFAMKLMTGLDWNSLAVAAVGLIAFTAAAFGLGALLATGAGAILFGAGVIGILALGAALIPLGFAAKLAGAGMKDLGVGLKMSVDSLVALTQLSFVDTIMSIKNLASTIIELSDAIRSMPKIDIENVRSLAENFPKFVMPTPAAKGEEISNKDIVDAIKQLNADMKNGLIRATSAPVYIDSQRVDSAQARAMAFKGPLSPQPTIS